MAAISKIFHLGEIADHATAEATKNTITIIAAGQRITIRTGEAAHDMAMTGVQTGTHAAGEGTKTGSTALGAVMRGAIRLGETIFHGVLTAIRVSTHIAGEILSTAVTIAQVGIRALAYIAVAAIEAAAAMASIPYVGPFLAVGAAAAMVALGMALLGGFQEGGYTGDGPAGQIAGIVHRGEYVIPASRVRSNLPLLQAIHSGSLADIMAPNGNVVTSPTATTAKATVVSPQVSVKSVIVSNMKEAALEAMASPAGEKVHVTHANKNRGKVGVPT